MSKRFLVLGGVSLVSSALGAVGGYYYAREKLIKKYDAILAEEVAAAEARFVVFKKGEEFETPEDAVRRLIPDQLAEKIQDEPSDETLVRVADGLKKIQYDKMYKEQGTPIPNVHGKIFEPPAPPEEATIFDEVVVELGDPEDDDVAGYDLGHNDVSNTKPFVVTKEDFFENEPQNDQVQWIYWAGDQTLMDEARNPVNEVNRTIGVRNLSHFGNGSGDKRIVYIRNQALGMDYEVLFHEGKYAEEVAGFTPVESRFDRGLHVQDDDE